MRTCKRGLHQFEGKSCRECSCEQKRKEYAANPEKYRAIGRAWALANREKVRVKSKIWRDANTERHRASNKAWRTSNPEKVRTRELNRNYNISADEWNAMFFAQGSKCAICSRTEHVGKNWHTDHCHATGRVRGILCHNCNHLLGGAKDKVEILRAAIDYLESGK